MKKSTFAVSIIFFLLLLEIALCLASQHIFAQSHNESLPNSTAQQQPMQSPAQHQSNNQNQSNNAENSASVNTFSGKIVKSGNKLVLAATDHLTTFQLDDQQRAHDFLNKRVRVTGSLDTSTGTIRVAAIDPSP
jgi:predicted membrane-bound mannosyltransferase